MASTPAAAAQDLGDDEKLNFGGDNDFSLRYDSLKDARVLRNESALTDEWVLPSTDSRNVLSSPLGSAENQVPGTSYLEDIQTDRFNTVRVADDAAEIQEHIDELNGAENSGPGGGVVLLKRKYYQPESTITLKKGVSLRGLQRGFNPSRNNSEWVYSAILGSKIPEENPIIETHDQETSDDLLDLGDSATVPSENGIHSGIIDLVVSGRGQDGPRNVHGVKLNRGGGYFFDGLQIQKCLGHGFWTRGAMDSHIRNSRPVEILDQ